MIHVVFPDVLARAAKLPGSGFSAVGATVADAFHNICADHDGLDKHLFHANGAIKEHLLLTQKFPLTFELANLATTVGVRHGLVSLGAQQYYSGGCLVGETTVKGGMLFERVLIGYGPVGNISASSGLFIFLDMAR